MNWKSTEHGLHRFSPGKIECDADTLKAILTHRYYVLAHDTRSVRTACRQEIIKLNHQAVNADAERIDARSTRILVRWLRLNSWDWKARRPITLEPVPRRAELFHTVYSMRQELAQLWSRSSASTEQLLKQLSDWRQRADSSGIAALREFSRRLPNLV